MSETAKIQNLQEGYQPRKDEETRGYHVTQQVDLKNLKIPQNMGDAAVTPVNTNSPAPTGTKSEKP